MIRIFSVILFSIFTVFAAVDTPWWPDKCGQIDTIISGLDTIITKYKCKESGRKELLTKRNGLYHGPYIAWGSNGKIIEKFNYYQNEFDGEVAAWDSTDYLISQRKYKRGTPIGFHKDYYCKNKPKQFIHFNNSGEKHGLCESWYENGAREDSVVYDNGTIIEARRYYTNGKIRYYKSKCKDALTYEAVFYDPSGKKTGEVKNGNGKYIIYSEDGSIPVEEVVKDGEIVSSKELEKE
jgi:antitoxin component YwqK of YwqJK toxin-antitoxin module